MFFLSVFFLITYTTHTSGLQYVEVFADRFEDDRIDGNKWTVENSPTPSWTLGGPVGVAPVQIQPSMDYVWEKEHKMFLVTNSTAGADWANHYFTSSVSTKFHFSLHYGEAEWSAQMPVGQGVSVSLSLVPDVCGYWQGHTYCDHVIDVLKYRGDFPNRMTFMVRSSYDYHSVQHDGIEITHPTSFAAGFNKFKVLWDDNQIKFYLNGEEKFIIANNNPLIPHIPMHLLMENTIGGWYAGLPNTQAAPEASYLIIEEVTVHRWQ